MFGKLISAKKNIQVLFLFWLGFQIKFIKNFPCELPIRVTYNFFTRKFLSIEIQNERFIVRKLTDIF